MERIERLLYELQYEVTRGMIEREIDEYLSFKFTVPTSRKFTNGSTLCEFKTTPVPHERYVPHLEPKLRVVK